MQFEGSTGGSLIVLPLQTNKQANYPELLYCILLFGEKNLEMIALLQPLSLPIKGYFWIQFPNMLLVFFFFIYIHSRDWLLILLSNIVIRLWCQICSGFIKCLDSKGGQGRYNMSLKTFFYQKIRKC